MDVLDDCISNALPGKFKLAIEEQPIRQLPIRAILYLPYASTFIAMAHHYP